jgi:hypothetical protein
MENKKNSYQKKAQKKEGVAAEHAKGDIKKSALETGRDVLIGAIGGGLAGAVLGRSSFLVGIAVTGVGHYMGSGGASAFGVGMMASGGYQAVSGAMSGTEKAGFGGVKERAVGRFKAFTSDIKHKLFLDKIMPDKMKEQDKSSDQTTNGVGEVQYFTYPNGKELQGANEHIDALNEIERQVAASARAFKEKQAVSGKLNGEDDMDAGEQNF